MTIEAKKNFDYQEAGFREVTALGLAGFSVMLLMCGSIDYHRGQELLGMSWILENPALVNFAKGIVGTGLKEVGLGIIAMSGSVVQVARRARM